MNDDDLNEQLPYIVIDHYNKITDDYSISKRTMNITNELRDLVYNWPTRHKVGFMPDELQKIKDKFPQINEEKFNMAMFGNTCALIEGEHCIYFCDVLTALRCGLENREMKFEEWV